MYVGILGMRRVEVNGGSGPNSCLLATARLPARSPDLPQRSGVSTGPIAAADPVAVAPSTAPAPTVPSAPVLAGSTVGAGVAVEVDTLKSTRAGWGQ